MKTIYTAIIDRLSPMIDKGLLRWIDLDRGQLKSTAERSALAYPCALVGIAINKISDLTDLIQECTATINVTLAFDTQSYGRTANNSPDSVREQGLSVYDTIADVYRLVQGYGTSDFDSLSRRSMSDVQHPYLFVYRLVFECRFDDETANIE